MNSLTDFYEGVTILLQYVMKHPDGRGLGFFFFGWIFGSGGGTIGSK